ncbi:MAG: hypothetical protein ACOX8S_05180 [Christensenellales bacterium]|jgi:4-hydroxy-tetrahydrodipicolinate synthase
MDSVSDKRADLIKRLFPSGVPRIFCPVLTHLTPDGEVDDFRMRAMIRSLAPHVGGLIAAGGTGDGWAMNRSQCNQVLEACLAEAKGLGMRVMFSVLEEETQDAYGTIVYHLYQLEREYGNKDAVDNLASAGLCGYSVCLPMGKHLTRQEIEHELQPLMELGVPIALVNAPDKIGYNIDVEIINCFASKYPNFYMYQDNSGEDLYVQSGQTDESLLLMRGSDYDYSQWYRYYDGFNLPSANAFAPALARVWAELEDESPELAEELSQKVSSVFSNLVQIAEKYDGDSRAIAARIADHFRAYGKDAWDMDMAPMLDGQEISYRDIEQAGDHINESGLLNDRGYMP